MTEGDDAVLPAHLVDERWAWWKARPRTPAWADRYGGGFAHVEALLLKSRRRQRLKRFAVAAAFLAVAGVAAIMFALWQAGLRARAEADANRLDAVRTTQVSVGRLAGFINDGTIRATGAAQILTDTKLTLDHIIAKTSKHTPNLSEVEISLLLAASDVKDALGDSKGAFDLALEAEELSMALLQKYPDGPDSSICFTPASSGSAINWQKHSRKTRPTLKASISTPCRLRSSSAQRSPAMQKISMT